MSNRKESPGFIRGENVNSEEFTEWVRVICAADDFVGVTKDTTIAVSSVKSIAAEWRCFVVDSEVVAGSRYVLDGSLNTKAGLPEEVAHFVKHRLSEYNPVRAFVLDIAKTKHGLKVIELNSINASGFYDSNVDDIVGALSTMLV